MAEIAAFGMTRRRGIEACDDPALVLLAESIAPVCTIVGKTWRLHLEKLVKVDPSENLRMIGESIAFLCGQGKRVIYDSEHFFDGWRDDPAYAIACLEAAAEAGAEDDRALRYERFIAAFSGGDGDSCRGGGTR